jgi:hypothetical protein
MAKPIRLLKPKLEIFFHSTAKIGLRIRIALSIVIEVLLRMIDKAGRWTIWREFCGSGDMAEGNKCGWIERFSHSRDHKSSDFLQYFFLKKVRRKIYSLRLNHPLSNDFTFCIVLKMVD